MFASGVVKLTSMCPTWSVKLLPAVILALYMYNVQLPLFVYCDVLAILPFFSCSSCRWGLTALDWHYESQCIPTPLAWYAHHLPHWFQRLSVVGTYFIEIGVPFLFFVPIRSLRLFAFWNQVIPAITAPFHSPYYSRSLISLLSQIFFQLCIILTGNYNFFNLLAITLCVSLLDDSACSLLPGWGRKIKGKHAQHS